jgi:transcriptional regulator with XRE-family HTH domain
MAQLSEVCGIPRSTLSAYNRGSRNPTLKTMKQIAQSIGIGVAELIDEDKDEIDENLDWFSRFNLEERLRYGLTHQKFLRRLGALKVAEEVRYEK